MVTTLLRNDQGTSISVLHRVRNLESRAFQVDGRHPRRSMLVIVVKAEQQSLKLLNQKFLTPS